MRIRYQPSRSTPEIEIRDLRGHKHGIWRRGEEQDFEPGETASFRESDGTIVIKPIADALFSCGPDFVDAATNRNPFFSCVVCGDVATDDFFVHGNTLQPHYIRVDETSATSPRLCMTDFLAAHPEHVARFKNAGLSSDIIAEAAKRRDNPPTAPTLAVEAAPVEPAPVDASVHTPADAPVDMSASEASVPEVQADASLSFESYEHHDDEGPN